MSSCVCLLTERFLNRLPITGMLPKSGNLANVDLLVVNQDATHDHSAAVVHQHRRFGLLGVDCGNALNLAGEIRCGILDVHLENDSAFVRNLRRHRQLQREIEELDRNRVVYGCLNRNLDALLDKTLQCCPG